MGMQSRINRKAADTYYYLLYKMAYVTGLTLIIPFIFTLALARESWYSKPAPYIMFALFLILFSFIGLMARKRNWSKTLKAMGMMTLFPGAIALFLFLFGESIIPSLFGEWSDVVFYMIKFSVPRMGMLVLGYLIAGVLLYYLGSRIRR